MEIALTGSALCNTKPCRWTSGKSSVSDFFTTAKGNFNKTGHHSAKHVSGRVDFWLSSRFWRVEIHCAPKGAQASSIMAITTEPVKVRQESNKEVQAGADWSSPWHQVDLTAGASFNRTSIIISFAIGDMYTVREIRFLHTTPTRAEGKKS
jgi:hypothetical protein